MVAIFAEKSTNVKIAGRGHVSATYLATSVSCPTSCVLMRSGCYAEMGNTGIHTHKLNKQAPKGMRPEAAARAERTKINVAFKGGPVPQDGVKGGRDLRLHVAGDARTKKSVHILVSAIDKWKERGGGSVWTYTHAWATVPRKEWGAGVNILASLENPAKAAEARKQGYAPALVVGTHKSDKAYTLEGSDVKWIPCPEQTRGVPCSDCRLCMDTDRLFENNMGIAFAAHGATQKIRKHLTVLA